MGNRGTDQGARSEEEQQRAAGPDQAGDHAEDVLLDHHYYGVQRDLFWVSMILTRIALFCSGKTFLVVDRCARPPWGQWTVRMEEES